MRTTREAGMTAMATPPRLSTLTIRNVDIRLIERLRIRAARHGRSMSAELRQILLDTLEIGQATELNLAEAIHRRFAPLGGVELLPHPSVATELEDPRTDRFARRIAALTGETPAEAILTSLAERLRRERMRRGHAADLADDLEAIARRGDGLPVLDDRTSDEILGVDQHDLPF